MVWIYKEPFTLLFLNVPHHKEHSLTCFLTLTNAFNSQPILLYSTSTINHHTKHTHTHSTKVHSCNHHGCHHLFHPNPPLLLSSEHFRRYPSSSSIAAPVTLGQAPSSSLRSPPTRFTADEYLATIKKLPFSQFSSVQSTHDSLPPSRLVFAADDYLKEIEDLTKVSTASPVPSQQPSPASNKTFFSAIQFRRPTEFVEHEASHLSPGCRLECGFGIQGSHVEGMNAATSAGVKLRRFDGQEELTVSYHGLLISQEVYHPSTDEDKIGDLSMQDRSLI